MPFGSKKPLKILAIEGKLIKAPLLRRLSFELSPLITGIECAESLDAALELLKKNRFDVLLLDLNLPYNNCLNALVKIRENHPYVPNTIITSGYDKDLGLKVIAQGTQELFVSDTNDTDACYKFVRHSIERDLTYELLDQKQKNLQTIFDTVPVGMLLVNEALIVKRVNDAIRRMVHRKYSQIINHRVGDALGCAHSTYSEKGCGYSPACPACLLRNAIESVLDSAQSVHEVEIQPTLEVDNGEIRPWFSISAEPATIDGAKHVVVAVADITDRKKMEEKLKETMELKSQFISMISHELRTPLGSMKQGIDIVLDEVVGKINEKQRNFLDIVKRNTDRLVRLIRDILDFRALEAGKMILNMRENSISIVATEVHSSLASSAKQKGVDLSLLLEDNLPKARFDRDKITQVLINLVDNAIKFTPKQGKVSIQVQHQSEELIIRVKDTGIGIPEEDIQKIFDYFYRVQQRGDKQIEGTGLGLAIVNNIMTMHGGRIEVESEVDQGTTFTLFLPLDPKPVPKALPEKADEILENSIANY